MDQLKNIRKSLTPIRSLCKQLSWLPDKIESFPKSPNSSLTIALISGERLYWSMQYEGNILALTESNWQWVLKYGGVDLLLIESCSYTATGDWFMAQTAPDLDTSPFGKMLKAAREYAIPVAYWFTLDLEYLSLYQPMIEWMGSVYCADDRVADSLKQQGIQAYYLPPAVQPALFTKLNQYTPEQRELYRVVCDDLVDVIQSWEERKSFYQDLQEYGGHFYDSRNQVWNTKTKNLDLKSERLMGTVDLHSRAALFKKSRTLAVLKSKSRTRTDMQWSIVEAAASHMTVLLEPELDVDEFQSLCLQPRDRDQFFVELIRHDKDSLYYERIAQKNWREVLLKHTYSHRIRIICQHMNVTHDWVEYPTAAMITPSNRTKFLDRAKKNFTSQTYPNKHWVMVFNGPNEEFERVKYEAEKVENGQAFYVPSELHAGPCMNTGIQKASTDYVFRMDDDDYYGDDYILDMMLYLRVVDFDIIGKSFRFFYEEDSNSMFMREVEKIAFRKPALCFLGQTPVDMTFITGSSQGGRKDFFTSVSYPNRNFGAVDSQWLEKLREANCGTVLCVDDFNYLVDRRNNNDHTWSANMDSFKKKSRKLHNSSMDVCFV